MNETIALTTARLRLRGPRPDDAPVLHQMLGCDPAITRFTGWNPYATLEAAQARVAADIAGWEKPGCYAWIIERDGTAVGTIGAYDYDPETRAIELGYSIFRAAWGNGYAGEAAAAVVRRLFLAEGIDRVHAWCHSDNKASARVLEKAGLRREGVQRQALHNADGSQADRLLYGVSRTDWLHANDREAQQMEIRQATPDDLDEMMTIYAAAQRFMAENGNPNQWAAGFPPRSRIEQDIRAGQSYVCTQQGRIAAVFCFWQGEEPTYRTIDGAWRNDAPYGVVHRIASAGRVRGAAAFCMAWCLKQCGNIRIDTHRDNKPMQRLLERLGYAYCGVIELENGRGKRLAYQKTAETAATE